jgi:hypothetical protein
MALVMDLPPEGGGGKRFEVNTLRTAPPLTGVNPLQGPLEGVALIIDTFLGPDMVTSETHVHKFTDVPVFLMKLGLIDFDGANPLLGPLKWVGHEKSQHFWAQVALSLPFQGPNKSRISRPTLFNGYCTVMDLPTFKS